MICKHDQLYVDIAHLVSQQSHDHLIKVGSVIVRDGQILSQGWNGMPSGMSNATRCSNKFTKPEVIHSEANALMKLARNGGGSDAATIYCTHSPCFECAKLILQAGITRVVYSDVYNRDSIQFLEERGLTIECIKPSNRIPKGKVEDGKRQQPEGEQRWSPIETPLWFG